MADAMGATGINSDGVQAILTAAIDLCQATNYYGPVDEAIKGIINNKSNLIK